MVLIYIEGLPGAGKSSLINELDKKNQKVFHELGRILPKSTFPGNGRTIEEIHSIDDRFIIKENARADYSSLLRKKEKIFFDRSFFSHLTYAYAYSRYMGIPSFQGTINKYQKAIEKGLLFTPSCLLYVDASSKTSIDRQNTKKAITPQKALPKFRREKSFLDDISYAYKELFKCFSGKILTIDAKIDNNEKVDIITTHKFVASNTNIDLNKYLSLLINTSGHI